MRSLQLTILSDEQMNLECRYFLYGITTRMSPRAVASAMLLTWNMRKVGPVQSRSFPAEDPGVGIEDMDAEELKEDGRTFTSAQIDAFFNSCPGLARRETAFLAASTLKMFAKAAFSWSLAWEIKYLQNRYTEFCKKKFPFESLKPKEEEIEKMRKEATTGTSKPLGTEMNASRLEDLKAVVKNIHHHFTVTQPAEDN